MDTLPTADIMDTPILEQVSPHILPVPLTHTEVSKVLASNAITDILNLCCSDVFF